MKSITFILLVAITLNVHGQKDVYYIKTNGDTVFCKDVSFTSLAGLKNVKYTLHVITLQNTKQKLDLTDISRIQGYFNQPKKTNTGEWKNTSKEMPDPFRHLENKILTQYEVVSVKEISTKNPVPLILVANEDGKKLLLRIEESTTISPNLDSKKETEYIYEVKYTYYLNEGSTTVELNKKNYSDILKSIFSKCEAAMNMLNENENYFNKIDVLVEAYYQCINKEVKKQE